MPDESPSPNERGSSRRRRRKRRHSPSGWGARILIVIGSLAVLVVLAWFGFGIWLKNYMKSESFHNQLSDRLAGKLKAKSEFEGLAWADNGVQLGKMISTGYEDAVFTSTTVDDVRADVKLNLWDRSVEIPLVTISRVNVLISEEGRLPRPYQSPLDEVDPDEAGQKESFFDSLKPNKFHLKETKIDDLMVSLKSKEGEIRLANIPLTLTSGQQADNWNIESHPSHERAVLMTNLGKGIRVTLKDFSARVRPEQIDLLELNGELEPLKRREAKVKDEFTKTRLTLNGNYRTGVSEPHIEAETTVTDIKLEDWVEEDWVKRLSGVADVKAHLSGSPKDTENLLLEGNFNMKRGTLTSLPILESLAERTKTQEFTRLELNTARWDFKHRGEVWNLDKIEIEARGLIRVEGHLTITGTQIKGVLNVGVAPGRLRAIDGAEQRVFTREENGYKWANPPMTISGTIDNIQEDLGTRIKDAWVDQQIENVTEIATKAPEAVIKGGAEVIEQGVKAAPSIINEGVRMFDSLLPKRR